MTNSAATNVTTNAARLNGEVTDTGGDTPSVTIYWGDNDGVTTPGNWDYSEVMGDQSSTYYQDISSLSPNTTYYFRSYATNSGGNDWADSTLNFTTDANAGPTSLFTDGFESGNFTTGGWSTQNGDASVNGGQKCTGSYGAKLRKTTWIEKAIDTSGYETIHVKFRRKTSGNFEGTEYLYVEWYDGDWDQVLESVQTAACGDGLQDYTCAAGADNNASFKIRFRINASNNNEVGAIDDVEVTGIAQ